MFYFSVKQERARVIPASKVRKSHMHARVWVHSLTRIVCLFIRFMQIHVFRDVIL